MSHKITCESTLWNFPPMRPICLNVCSESKTKVQLFPFCSIKADCASQCQIFCLPRLPPKKYARKFAESAGSTNPMRLISSTGLKINASCVLCVRGGSFCHHQLLRVKQFSVCYNNSPSPRVPSLSIQSPLQYTTIHYNKIQAKV